MFFLSVDFLTVNETAQDFLNDEAELKINTPSNLSMEATYINQNFSQQVFFSLHTFERLAAFNAGWRCQVLKHDEPLKLGEPNPFAEEGDMVASVGYRYRKWDLGDGSSMHHLSFVVCVAFPMLSRAFNYFLLSCFNRNIPGSSL